MRNGLRGTFILTAVHAALGEWTKLCGMNTGCGVLPLPYPRDLIRREWKRNITCQRDRSYQYGWIDRAGVWGFKDRIYKMMNGSELCQVVPRGTRVLLLGDSLSDQFGHSWSARLCADLNRVCKPTESCSGGAVVWRETAMVNWWVCVDIRCTFDAGDKRVEHCAKGVNNNTLAYALHDYSPPTLEFSKFINKTRPSMLVINQMAHLGHFLSKTSPCYTRALPETGLSLLKSDVQRFWRKAMAGTARFLRDEYPHLRVILRTSPPAADGLYTKGHYNEVPLTGGADFEKGDSPWEYEHGLYRGINDLTVAAFLAAGHDVVDVEIPMGVRIDGHPASHSTVNRGDALHYCMPGVPDFGLDFVLRAIFGPSTGRYSQGHIPGHITGPGY